MITRTYAIFLNILICLEWAMAVIGWSLLSGASSKSGTTRTLFLVFAWILLALSLVATVSAVAIVIILAR